MKKILSLILALLMSASAASMIGAAEEAAIADDAAVETEAAETTAAAETSQYDEAIAFLHSYGIYKGKSATDLAAADPIERYQMALFVARISTGWVDDAQWASSTWVADQWYDRDHDTSGFDDLEGTPAVNYLGALSYASQKGIIEGYGNKKFGPTDGITYQNALTMIVRTLGYTNLAWPWGYIEKAVTLGLTVGIPSSVKYTDELNRGEVAQLIYNALFIPTKEGDTLAARNFNGELGWETIIITVAGRGRYLVDAKLGDQGYPTDAGKDIGFNVVNADGTLDATTYYVKNDDPVSFNFENHEERYLGYAYKALFNKDENSNYVTLISVKSLKADEVWNFGLPTKGEDGKYPITTYLAGKNIVSKFSKNTYLNTVGVQLNGEYTIDNARNYEFILKNALQGGTVKVDAGRMYAIDWITGNILKLNEEDKGVIALPAKDVSGKDVSKLDGIERKYTYDVAWYYNELLNQYFRFKTVDKNGEIQFVGIDIMDPADLQSLIDNQMLKKDQAVNAGLADTGISNTAYASLVSFNLPGYTAPNYGLYEEYRFGQYTEGKVKLNDHEVDGSMIIKSLDAVAKPMYEEVTGKTDFASGTVSFIKEGACGHNHAIGFFSEDGLTPSVGDYIIYSADKATGEVKVVKIIYDASNEKADKDNFVATGVVRAYNTTEGVTTVTIGETKYSYNYNDLLGNPFGYAVSSDKTWGPLYRAAFSRYFKTLFNQYVKYVVVDGKLVWVEKANASNQLIVVDSYAGLSSDGYIVVNGYKTDDLKYAQFRIGSYNGWVKGDYYYYLTNEKVEDSFTRGSLYRITSYDKNADVYYVYTVGKDFKVVGGEAATDANGYILHYHDKDGNIIEVTTDTYEYMTYDVDGLGWKYQTLDFADGYRSVDGSTSFEKTNSKDTYVLICNKIDDMTRPNTDWTGTNKNYKTGGDYAPIIVYTGRVSSKWHVEGFRVTGTGDNSFVFVGVDFNKIVGFDADQYDISYVLFLHYDYTKAAYDSADADGWYLLGASNFEATVFNWYNGEIETKTAVNKDLKMGYSYPSINGVIVNDAPYAAWELDAEIPGAYQWQWEINSRSTPHYLFGCSDHIAGYAGFVGLDSEDGDTYKAAFNKYFDKENFSKEVISAQKGLSIKVKDLVNSVKVFLVEADADTEKIVEVERADAAVLSKWARDNKIDLVDLYFWWIMDKDGNVVVYIDRNSGKVAPTVEDVYGTFATAEDIVISSGAEQFRSTNFNWFGNRADTKADIDTAAIKAGLYGKLNPDDDTPVNITKINLEWGSDLLAGTADLSKLGHHEIDVKDFHFGRKGYCEKENFYIRITDAEGNLVRAYDYEDEDENCIITKMYDAQLHDETECDLIQALEIPVGPITVNYPDLEDYLGEIEFDTVTEDLIKFYCGGGCECEIEDPSDIYEIIKNGYETNEYTMNKAVAERLANAINVDSVPEETTFTVEFRDSSDTEYLFNITVYVKALFKAEVDKYGHWTVGFDKYLVGADITGSRIMGQNYKFDSTQPEYKDRYVGQADRSISSAPVFDLQTLTYTYED